MLLEMLYMKVLSDIFLDFVLQNNSPIFQSLNPLCGWLLSAISRQMQTAELFNFAKWLMLSSMVELRKRMSIEIQNNRKCQVNSNYPTNIWHSRYFSCERDSNFRRFADFKWNEA